MSTTTERVGRYQLLEPIGVGPDGSVSRAKVFGVAGFERQFAVKRFHPELTTMASMAQALSAAARAYGGLEHPRIARMSEFGVAQGTTFTAVEYVAGLDALRLINEARTGGTLLAAGGALALVSQAARAVGYAHGRGLTHLGLAPTNVIVTSEGDVKITDFGILSATLPPRPIDHARLAQRIQYLAPEQLANEATSAATDVFALGVLAYELVTGQRTFKGDTPQQIAQSVMSGPPAEPSLPRPIVRVLQRCLARSPFERFPDARALADALDAALRVAPVPGTRKDIGSQVKATLDRLADMHSGELSGMVALNLGTANLMRGPVAPVAALGNRDSQAAMDMATTEFVRSDTKPGQPTLAVPPARPTRTPGELEPHITDLAALASASSTVPDLPKIPMTTVTGLAPPPIPVPKGVSSPPSPSPPASPHAPSTLLGLANQRGKVPNVPNLPSTRPVLGAVPPPTPRPAPPPPIPTPPPMRVVTPPPGSLPTAAPEDATPPPDRPTAPALPPEPAPPRPVSRPLTPAGPPERPSETPVSPLRAIAEMPRATAAPVPLDELPFIAEIPARDSDLIGAPNQLDASRESLSVEISVVEPLPDEPGDPENVFDKPTRPVLDFEVPSAALPEPARKDFATNEMSPILVEKLSEATKSDTGEIDSLVDQAYRAEAQQPPPEPPKSEIPSIAGATARQYPIERTAAAVSAQQPAIDARPRRSRVPWIIAGVVVALGLGAAAYFVVLPMLNKTEGDPKQPVATSLDAGTARPDAQVVAVAADDAAVKPVIVVDAGDEVKAPADAQVAIAPPSIDAGAKPGDGSLSITSTPAGARVFLDGADAGVTPLKLPGTPDRHTVAILLAGHELYVAQVDGRGAFAIPLKEVTPTGGPAGIKVLKCKDKDRYYVFVDGKPTGQTCPTERIETEIGPHVVEVYDVVSETRRKWEINVQDTRLSYRVRVD